ncbi:MAG: hypothetical protein GF350_07820 [Chitinivibrionales bacterium]|nr:hypothetical protein [Chitinivibrionales bacterium]
MSRNEFIEMAEKQVVIPLITDLVLHEHKDVSSVLSDGRALGRVIEEAARRFQSPLAIPRMDLTIEKEAVLDALGAGGAENAGYRLSKPLSSDEINEIAETIAAKPSVKMKATCDALSCIAAKPDLKPSGMCIGPFSLITRLLADPITPVFLYGMGVSKNEDPSVGIMQDCLELATAVVDCYCRMQIDAGARAMFVCEPAANTVYCSPQQVTEAEGVFDNLVLEPNLRLKALFGTYKTDMIFHDCGELNDTMLAKIARLHPVMLSLGSSRVLWDDARIVPGDVVLYGNLPSKHFYDDTVVSEAQVDRLCRELVQNMKQIRHPFILGTECDVLFVPEYRTTISGKIDRMKKIADELRK